MWSEMLVTQLYTILCKPRELNLPKKEMTSVNTDILEINELTWTEWVNWIQMTTVSTTVFKNPLEEME